MTWSNSRLCRTLRRVFDRLCPPEVILGPNEALDVNGDIGWADYFGGPYEEPPDNPDKWHKSGMSPHEKGRTIPEAHYLDAIVETTRLRAARAADVELAAAELASKPKRARKRRK